MHNMQPGHLYAIVNLLVAVPLDNGCPPGQESAWAADSINEVLNAHLDECAADPAIVDWAIRGEPWVRLSSQDPQEGELFHLIP